MSYLNYSFNSNQSDDGDDVILEVVPRMTMIVESIAHPSEKDSPAFTILLGIDGGRSEQNSSSLYCNEVVEGRDAIGISIDNFAGNFNKDANSYDFSFHVSLVARTCDDDAFTTGRNFQYSVGVVDGEPLASFDEIKEEVVQAWHSLLKNAGFVLKNKTAVNDLPSLSSEFYHYESNFIEDFSSSETQEAPFFIQKLMEKTQVDNAIDDTRYLQTNDNNVANEGLMGGFLSTSTEHSTRNKKIAGVLAVIGLLSFGAVAGVAYNKDNASNHKEEIAVMPNANQNGNQQVPQSDQSNTNGNHTGLSMNTDAMGKTHAEQVQNVLAQMGVDLNQQADVGCLVE